MTTDPNIQEALKQIASLKAELAKWERYVELHRELFRDKIDSQPLRSFPINHPEKRWTAAAIVDAALDVLAHRGRPMKLGDLYQALVAQGVQIGGKNPRNNLGAMLSGDKIRLCTGPDGWWFKDEIQPPRINAEAEYEEGPDTEVSRPLQTNGAAVSAA